MEDSLITDELNDHYKQCQMRFPQKLRHLLLSGSDAILWGGQGRSILLDLNILKSYLRSDASIFKTSHLSSFIRQLNLYGFRKVTSHQQDPMCNSTNPHMQEYAHDCFVYKRPDLVDTITRRSIHSKHIKPKETDSGTYVKSSKHSMLEQARNSFRNALADAVRRVHRAARSRTPSPPPSHHCIQYYFTDLSDREEPQELNLELPSRRLPHPLLPSDNVIHVPLPSLTPTEVPALHTLDENLSAMEEDSNDKLYSVPPQNLVIFNNEGCVVSGGSEAENFSAGSNSTKQLSAIDCAQNTVYNMTEPTNSLLNDTCVSVSLSDNGEVPNRDRREWEQLLRELGRELDPASTATTQRASDLRQLYLHISRTMDLLNS